MKKKVVVALGWYDPYCYERIQHQSSGLYRFSDVSLLCYVAGLHRIRPAECDSRRTDRTRHLSQRMHRYHTGNC